MRICLIFFSLLLVGCGGMSSNGLPPMPESTASLGNLTDAKQGFVTKITKSGEDFGPPETPIAYFDLIHYDSPVGKLAAYVSKDRGDGEKHPAIVWITGGDNNSIGDVWTPMGYDNDQGASAFREAGFVMMFPSQRGGNDNPGQREGFLGEVEDILAATDYLATLPNVDPEQIYLGGHSTGGTLAMLVGESTDRYRAIFALGPVAGAGQYGGDYVYCNVRDDEEMKFRSPIMWMHCVKTPMYVFEGAEFGNWDAIQTMDRRNKNPNIQFFRVPNHDHFTVIYPVTRMLTQQIREGQINITPGMLEKLR
ncbi:MAG: prolyl oligopeptidase family serine peptidase [Planctomycetaceae bacterium]|nr:prolyl oligopeptidase family serine peptidase [Planctomycetaceae bacterium]